MSEASSNRWTSTAAQLVPGDGVWRNYSYSILEDDLTQVVSTGTYDDLVTGLDRIMLRHDEGEPSVQGTPVEPEIGAFNIDKESVFSVHPANGTGDQARKVYTLFLKCAQKTIKASGFIWELHGQGDLCALLRNGLFARNHNEGGYVGSF